LPVKYRTTGERRWHQGITVKLSASGAVIDGELPPSRTEAIVVVISFPSAGGCLTGFGRILRTPAPHARAYRRGFAIAVPHYRLEHRSAALARFDALLQGC
jgi:hypothetical protein